MPGAWIDDPGVSPRGGRRAFGAIPSLGAFHVLSFYVEGPRVNTPAQCALRLLRLDSTPMEIFLTGGTGFIGKRVAKRLLDRGDRVRALARTAGTGRALTEMGCELVGGDVGDMAALGRGMHAVDGVVHMAAMYEVGIPESLRPTMYATNVGGTENVLDVALDSGVSKIVHVSALAAIGDTGGQIAGEDFERAGTYNSYYEETKHLAQLAAESRARAGAPLVTVLPGLVYGPGDTSIPGRLIEMSAEGRLPAIPFARSRYTFCHVDDVADGIVGALDHGRLGERYILGGERATLEDLCLTAARIAGKHRPPLTIPVTILRVGKPLAALLAHIPKMPADVGELIASGDSVTYLGSSGKARREIAYRPRGIEDGITQMLGAPSAS